MVDGVTWSCKDGVVSATGNATGMANTLYTDLSYIFPIKAGTYKISGANDKILIIARITKSDDSLEYLEPGFTLDGTEKEVRIYVRAANTGAISSTIYPMLNVGTTDLPWRPYGHNVTVRSAGAQLYDAAQMNGQTSAGVTALVADVGEIILNGTATANAFLNSPVEYPFSGHIYASMNNDAANDNVMFRFVDESDAIIDNFVINTAKHNAYKFPSASYAQPRQYPTPLAALRHPIFRADRLDGLSARHPSRQRWQLHGRIGSAVDRGLYLSPSDGREVDAVEELRECGI